MAHAHIPPVLEKLLVDFAERVNAHARLRITLSGWKPDFYIQARDNGHTYQVHVSDGMIQCVQRTTDEPGDDALLLRADEATLSDIFSGGLSPLAAYTDGLLEIYGSQKDQIKLDAIALIIWRV